jgi:hypothetical protein
MPAQRLPRLLRRWGVGQHEGDTVAEDASPSPKVVPVIEVN